MSEKPLRTLTFKGLGAKYTIPDGAEIEKHFNNKNNPHGVTAAQVGAAPAGYGD